MCVCNGLDMHNALVIQRRYPGLPTMHFSLEIPSAVVGMFFPYRHVGII